jgi:hypothetical protein
MSEIKPTEQELINAYNFRLRIKATQKKYYDANKEKILKQKKEYYSNNEDVQENKKQYVKEYYNENHKLDKYIESRKKAQKAYYERQKLKKLTEIINI